jgi:hypothetical protein
MKTENGSFRQKALLVLATVAAAIGGAAGLPMKKAAAAPADWKMARPPATNPSPDPTMAPAPTFNRRPARMDVIQPRFVSPTAVTLLKIADQALSDSALAERIAHDPDSVAAQFQLSNSERMVLRHMDGEQFQVARADAARLVRSRLSMGPVQLPPGATDAHLITERMIVGRAILAAVGRSYLDAANAHACCPWSKAIELGVSSDPVTYNGAFERPAGAALSQ